MNNLKVLPYLSLVKPAPYSYSLSFQSYGPNCIVDLESFVSGEFSEFLNMVKTSPNSLERTKLETLQLVV